MSDVAATDGANDTDPSPRPAHDRASLLATLARMGIETTTVEHGAVHTVEEASTVYRDLPGEHTKNLFVKDKKGRVFLVAVPSRARVALKELHKVIGAQGRLSFGRPEQLYGLLGVRPGSVTLFGAVNDTQGAVTVVMDRIIAEAEIVCAHPLENTATTAIGRDDLRRFLAETGHAPMIVDVPRESPGDASDS